MAPWDSIVCEGAPRTGVAAGLAPGRGGWWRLGWWCLDASPSPLRPPRSMVSMLLSVLLAGILTRVCHRHRVHRRPAKPDIHLTPLRLRPRPILELRGIWTRAESAVCSSLVDLVLDPLPPHPSGGFWQAGSRALDSGAIECHPYAPYRVCA